MTLVENLRAVMDELRGGSSLRQAIARVSRPESPLVPVAAALAAGRPLVASLRDAAAAASDQDLASALGVLAVHAEAGGDPLAAVGELADRLTEREAARREARVLTTQARLGARVILLITPAFLLLVVATDPRAAAAWLADTQTRTLVLAGLVLQAVGAAWMAAIVGGVAGRPRWAESAGLRAVYALVVGRPRPAVEVDAADAAEVMSFALDAGLSPSRSLCAVAPYAAGPFGRAMRLAAGQRAGVPAHQALSEATAGLGCEAAARFCSAMRTSASLGVPLAPALRDLAVAARREAALRLAEDVRRASIRVLVPLGLLVLPAFVLACLVPLLAGGLRGLSG